METQKRRNISSGIFLILLGLIFLVIQIFPSLTITFTWPMIIIFVALGLLVIGMLTGAPEMAIPGCIVGGIGGILYLQNAGILTWESWAYLWTLIPGFVGLGIMISGLLRLKMKQVSEGLEAILVSAVLFAIFGSIFGNVLGFFPFKGYVLPLLLIAVGLISFVRALLGTQKR